MNSHALYSSLDVAKLLNVAVSTVYEYNNSSYLGFPRGFKIGAFWRWFPEDIHAWIDAQISYSNTPKKKNNLDKNSRIIAYALDMYNILSDIAHSKDFHSNQDILKILALIDDD